VISRGVAAPDGPRPGSKMGGSTGADVLLPAQQHIKREAVTGAQHPAACPLTKALQVCSVL
jgi:hypothetical protein